MSQQLFCRNQNNGRWCTFNREGQRKRDLSYIYRKGKGKRRGETVAQMESALLSPKPSEDEFVPFFLIDGFGAAGFSEV